MLKSLKKFIENIPFFYNYDFIVENKKLIHGRFRRPKWNLWKKSIEELDKYDYIMMVDADTAIVDFTNRIESFIEYGNEKDIIIQEWGGTRRAGYNKYSTYFQAGVVILIKQRLDQKFSNYLINSNYCFEEITDVYQPYKGSDQVGLISLWGQNTQMQEIIFM